MKVCRRCGSRLRTYNVTPGYKYWCPHCDEDMYGLEAVEKKGETMYFRDTWSFLVELDNGTICPIDLSQEEDWNALEPFRNDDVLGCTLGHYDHNEEKERLDILRVWEYKEDEPFNGAFSAFKPCSMECFVKRILDADETLFGVDSATVEELRNEWLYGH